MLTQDELREIKRLLERVEELLEKCLFEEAEPLPDELKAIEEFEREKDNLELIPLEEVERELGNSN